MPSDEMLVHIIDDDQAMRESLVFLLQHRAHRCGDFCIGTGLSREPTG